jgi:hypothetical protein
VLYYLSHIPNSFYFHYFSDRVSHFAWATPNHYAPIHASHVAEMIGMNH